MATQHKKVDKVFKEAYPQLVEQLEELGITEVQQLIDRFNINGKYLVETLDYELKDNEKIHSMAKDAVEIPLYIFIIGFFLSIAFLVWVIPFVMNL